MIKEISAPTKIGDTRKIKCFAWFPTKVTDDINEKWYKIWFRDYTAHQKYQEVNFELSDWVTYRRTI